MKRAIIVLIALASYLASHAQLLYRVTGGGLTAESYIIGTYHLADGAMVDSIPGARQALETVGQVCGELPMADLNNPDSLRMMMSYMYLPEGQTLKGVLSESEYSRLAKCYKEVLGVGLDNPMVQSMVERMTPATVNNNLTLALCMKKSHRKMANQNTIDTYLQRMAKESGRPTIGLETMSLQAKTLYSMPMERQVELLMCLVDNLEYYTIQTASLSDAYYAQNINKIHEVMEATIGTSCDNTDEEKDRLIKNRNRSWIKLMPDIMRDKQTLFAVGAGHLPGEDGIIQLLRNAGYTVEAVR